MQVTRSKPDVRSPADVALVVRSFYSEINQDPQLGRFFADVDWDIHIPKMTAFWSSVIFHTGEYNGRPFDPHARLQNLGREHFTHWLARFNNAIDMHFEGEATERMKLKAQQIATVFQVKLGLWTTLS